MKLSICEAAKRLGIATTTLRGWDNDGKIKSERTDGGHRRYDEDEVNRLLGVSNKLPRQTILYGRVSTAARKNNLESQIQVLQLFCAAHGWTYHTITDIGSGLNYKNKGLLELIKLIETNQVERLIINYKDRLLRFGSEIIFEMCRYHGTEVIILTEDEDRTYEKELVDDVLSVITVFSARLYGSRSHKNQKIVETNTALFRKDGHHESKIETQEKSQTDISETIASEEDHSAI